MIALNDALSPSSRLNREYVMAVQKPALPSLQLICASKVCRQISLATTSTERQEFISYLSLPHLPRLLREVMIHILAHEGTLTKSEFRCISNAGLDAIDLSGLKADLTSDVFEGLWSVPGGVSSLILQKVDLLPCLFWIMTSASLSRPLGANSLLSLDLSNVSDLSDHVMEYICDAFTQLRSLLVPNCLLLSSSSLMLICSSSFRDSLTELDYSFNCASAEGLRCVSRDVPQLSLLRLGHLNDVEDCDGDLCGPRGLSALSLAGLPTLSSPAVSGFLLSSLDTLLDLRLAESQIESSDVDRICSGMARHLALTHLDLSWCENVTAVHLARFVCMCPRLLTLLLQSTKLDSCALIQIAACCPLLETINISRCVDIEDHALESLLNCPKLTSLDVGWAPIGTDALVRVLEGAPSMQVISLQGCKSVTPVLFEALSLRGRGCLFLAPRLRFLDLSWVNMCSETLARSFSQVRSDVFVVDYYLQGFREGLLVAEDFY
jgi:hypothetical protein